jgi:hypothetical protein
MGNDVLSLSVESFLAELGLVLIRAMPDIPGVFVAEGMFLVVEAAAAVVTIVAFGLMLGEVCKEAEEASVSSLVLLELELVLMAA